MSFFKSLFKTSGIYFLSNIFIKSFIFFLIPVLTLYLTPRDYGIISILEIMLVVLMPIIGVNVRGAISVNYYHSKNNIEEYTGNTLYIVFVSFFIVFVLFYVLKYRISKFVGISPNWLILIPLASLGKCFSEIILVNWQIREKALSYSIYQVVMVVLEVSLSLYLVIVLKENWTGRFSGIVITAVLFGIVAVFILLKKKLVVIKFNLDYIKDALIFGVPLIPHAIGTWAMSMIDRVFINRMIGIEATGIYTVGYQIGMIILLIANSFNLGWVPFFYEKLKKSEDDQSIKLKLVKITYTYNVIIFVFAMLLGLIAPWIVKTFIGKSFSGSFRYVMWVALGCAFNGMYFMVANYIFYAKKTHLLAYVTFFSAIFNSILTYVMIKYNGAVGAAQATCVTFFVFYILTWILSNKVYSMPWLFRKVR